MPSTARWGLKLARTRLTVVMSSLTPASAKKLTLQRDEYRVRRDERVNGEKAERGWAIDEDEIELFGDRSEELAETVFALRLVDELELGACQAALRGKHLELFELGVANQSLGGDAIDDPSINGLPIETLRVDTESARQIRLRVHIDDKPRVSPPPRRRH